MTHPAPETAGERRRRRLRRLREELLDADVPIDLDGASGEALIEELDYARFPHTHEGVSPVFGALIVPDEVIDPARLGFPALVEITDIDHDVVRRLADGRTSFIARHDHGVVALVSFDRTIEHEATAVQVATSAGITVVQRQYTGSIRVFAPNAVITWDGARWWSKPLASQLARTIRAARPELLSPVLDGLTEFCVHWLSAGRVGALLVWQTEGTGSPSHLGVRASVAIPPLEMTERQHYAALRNALAQTDRAALVSPGGRVDRIGVALRWSEEAVAVVPAYRGTRHTSARRFSRDEPSAVVFAVSSAGPVSVLHGGEIISVATTTPPGDTD
ncbi:diadenylate cyclase [Desertimonas flava]|jgi:hypothetical protein|uniref:diadenylate cyclase n=1 Tax=Desertimonas flava TaxID=2064846 RepID=UPI0013C46E99|nr:diadenylate cyclase [Desertimonas flava]